MSSVTGYWVSLMVNKVNEGGGGGLEQAVSCTLKIMQKNGHRKFIP